mmetsp:Transcript_60503/g.141715  ORF Transcript_60503/g.141715 Transcript_60503/m.141715 type:complete len:129 (+) Transcript_60503:3-389(+)
MALEKIWIRPAEALKECPSISPELLEEILRPCLICMPNSELQAILRGWSCKKRKAGEEATLPSPLQPTIERHMGRMEDELARCWSEYGPAWETLGQSTKMISSKRCGMTAQRWHKPKEDIRHNFWVRS